MQTISKSDSQITKSSGKIEPYQRKKRRKNITEHDVKELARLVAECKLTETEASNLLDINERVWFSWKAKEKNKLQYDDILTRIRAAKITNCIESINKIGDGIGMKQPDWRAKQFILQITAPERFSLNKESSNSNAPTVNIQIMSDALKRIYSTLDNQISEGESSPCQKVTRFLPVRNTAAD